MSRRDRKPLAKSRAAGDRPRGATPFRNRNPGDRMQGDRPPGKRPGGKPARFAEPRRERPPPVVAEPEKAKAEVPLPTHAVRVAEDTIEVALRPAAP